MAEPILEVENLSVGFETQHGFAEVLNGIDFEIGDGETIAVVGETGCGKSVTAKSILGILPPTSQVDGQVHYKGERIDTLPEREMHKLRGSEICMIMQDPMTSINPVFTIGEQMVDVLRYQGKPRLTLREWLRDKFRDDDELREHAIEMLQKTQIPAPENIIDRYPHELSGGMRQRVLISIALMSEPKLLISDEPGTALDVTTEEKILHLLDDLSDDFGTSMMYITHDLGVAKKISDRVLVMYAGEIVESGPTDEVLEEPLHPYTRGLLESLPRMSGKMGKGIEGSIPNYIDPPPACRFVDRCSFAKPACREVYPYPREAEDGRAVACHLYHGPPVQTRHETLAEQEEVDIGRPPWL